MLHVCSRAPQLDLTFSLYLCNYALVRKNDDFFRLDASHISALLTKRVLRRTRIWANNENWGILIGCSKSKKMCPHFLEQQ